MAESVPDISNSGDKLNFWIYTMQILSLKFKLLRLQPTNIMYDIILWSHSWIRWVLLIICLIVTVRSFYGWSKKSEYLRVDNLLGVILLGLFHLQLILGLALYFVFSPITGTFLSNIEAGMKDPVQRFWGMEHILLMIFAVVIAHLGRLKTKNTSSSTLKFKAQTLYNLIAFLVIVSRIPWGDTSRLFRGLIE